MIAWKECKYGHDLTNGGSYITPSGRYQCRLCKQESNARRPKATQCKFGHDLTDPANVYQCKGRSRCRICKRLSDTRTRANRRNNIRAHDKPVRTYPWKYQAWAKQTWALLTPYEQWLVSNALTNTDLEPSP